MENGFRSRLLLVVGALASAAFLLIPDIALAQTATATTTSTSIPRDQVIVKQASPQPAAVGGIINYTVTIRLDTAQQNVVVRDVFSGIGVQNTLTVPILDGTTPVTIINTIVEQNRITIDYGLGNLSAGTHTLTYQATVPANIECQQTIQDEAHLILNGQQVATSTVVTNLTCETATPTVTGTPPTATPTVTGTPPTATPTETPGGGGGNGGVGVSATATPTETAIPGAPGPGVAGATAEATPAPGQAPVVAGATPPVVPGTPGAVTATPTETPVVAGAAAPAAPTPPVAGVAGVTGLPAAGEPGDSVVIEALLTLAALLIAGWGLMLSRSR